MPNTKSATKALRKSESRRNTNNTKKRALLTTIKDYKKALGVNREEAKGKLPMVYKKIDKAAKTNLIKKNRAARLKSRLTRKLLIKNG